MTLTIDLEPEVEGGLTGAARRQGQTPEKMAGDALRVLFGGGSVTVDTLLAEDAAEDSDRAAFGDALFLAGAEATRHVRDTAEEDAAWAHLQ